MSDLQQEQGRLVKSTEAGGIGQTFSGSGQDWSNFRWEWARLVKPSAGGGEIGQVFCGSGRDWSNRLQEWAGLVKLSAGMGGIGQTFCRSEQDWSDASSSHIQICSYLIYK